MIRMNKLAAAMGAALTLGYGASVLAIPSPGAVADAYLALSNFTILSGNGFLGKSGVPLDIFDPITNPTGKIILDSVVTNADVLASLNGVTNSTSTAVGLGVPFSLLKTAGGPGFIANTTLPSGTINPGSYAGSSTSSFGNALDPSVQPGSICGPGNMGDCVPVHNQVNLSSFNSVGSALSHQNLITDFTFTALATQNFELSFDAEGFLRAALGQAGTNANASYSWTATVRAVGSSTDILKWTPNGFVPANSPGITNNGFLVGVEGTCVAAGTCKKFADGFSMSNNVGLLTNGDVSIINAKKAFEAELVLAAGKYTFTISHNTEAKAAIAAIPEPGTLALLGLGLLGVGASRRRTPA